MRVIVVDDENIILQMEANMIKNILPQAQVEMFIGMDESIEFVRENAIDIAFLDINLEAGNGIKLAKALQEMYPQINIIFCTGYSEYSLEALELYCSAYLMKPITEEKIKAALKKLRYPISDKVERLYIKCFGNFEVTYNGTPIKFRYGKTKEMLAYLIDRKGAVLSIKEIMAAICEEDDKESFMRNVKADLINTFQLLGIDQILTQDRGKIGVKPEKIDCDYYDYLSGNKGSFRGEYMSQYSFAEGTLANIHDASL